MNQTQPSDDPQAPPTEAPMFQEDPAMLALRIYERRFGSLLRSQQPASTIPASPASSSMGTDAAQG